MNRLGWLVALILVSAAPRLPAQEEPEAPPPDAPAVTIPEAPPPVEPLPVTPVPVEPPSAVSPPAAPPPAVVTPPPPVVPPPAAIPPPIPVRPPVPSIDPELRTLYLGEQGTRLGSPKGPRDLKTRRPEKKDSPWKHEVEVGATGYRGNTDADLATFKAASERKDDESRLKLSARGAFGNKDGERDRQNAGAEAAYRHDLEGRFYLSTELRYFYDDIADLQYQVVGLFSLGYDVVASETAVLSLEAGPAYIVQRKGGVESDFAAVRLAASAEKMMNDRVLVWQRAEYLPAIEDTGVFLVIAEVGIESVLSARLRFRTALQNRYDSDPAPDKETSDTFLVAALVAAF